VISGKFDVGLAFDGDADRVFLVDENGKSVSGSTTTALLASVFLRTNPKSTILYNLICSRVVPETITSLGGTPIRTKNGHSYMKQVMAQTGAVFAGEHSGHYYFADNYRADSGLIATMVVLGEMCRTGKTLSELRAPFEKYSSSGEINTQVEDISVVIDRVAKKFSAYPQDHLDGLTVDCGSWWFNVRASNTEPLLRLNLEAATREECDEHVAELLMLITA
jgi:phosphomannomutase